MSGFDDLTLNDIEEISKECLGGKTISDPLTDPLVLAGAVLWATQRKTNPALDWGTFKATTSMRDIKAFSIEMEHESLDPTQSQPNVLT